MKTPDVFKEMGFPSIEENPGWWIHKILTDLFFLCKFVLHHEKQKEYRDLNWVHKRLCDFIIKNPALQKLILMFRDSLKSSIARALMLQWFLQKAYARQAGNGFIYSGVFDLAQDHAEKIIKEILSNRILQYLFYYLSLKQGKQSYIPHKKKDFNVIAFDKGKIRYKRIEIDIGSPEKSLTGHHYEIGIIDNAVNEVNSQNQDGRAKIIRRWQEMEPIFAEDAREFIFETTWWSDDLSGYILDANFRFDFRKIYRKPCLEFVTEGGYAVFICPVRDEDGNPVFPEKVDEKYIARKKSKMSSYLYNALYELQPTREEAVQIRPAWIFHYKEDPPVFIRNMILDCAGTKEKQSSFSAITLGDWSPDARLHIPFAERKKLTPMELYHWMIKIYYWSMFVDKRPVTEIGIEKEKYGIFLYDLVKVNTHKLPVTLLEIKNIPRDDRNTEVVKYYESGRILSKPGLKDYEDEALSWYRGKQKGTDIYDTIYYHFVIKNVPKKIDFKPVPVGASDFVKQAKRDMEGDLSSERIAQMF